MRSTLMVKNGAEYIRKVDTTKSYRITNHSRFTAVDVYLDGAMPSENERIFGSARPKHRIFPLGWLIISSEDEKLVLAPDGFSQEYQSGNWLAPDENVPVLIEEFDEYLGFQEYDPPVSVIGTWNGPYATAATEGAYRRILLTQLDSSMRLPQVREKGIMFVDVQSETGGAGSIFNYLYMQDYLRNFTGNYTNLKIPFGTQDTQWSDDLGGGNNGTTYFVKHVFKNNHRLGDMVIFTSDAAGNQQTFCGGMYYVTLPHQSDERRYIRSWSIAALGTGNIMRRPSYGLTKIEVAWKQAGAGAGSIAVKHYTASGTLIATDTTVATGAAEGFITITPKAGFVDIEITAGANGALNIDAWESRKYTVA